MEYYENYLFFEHRLPWELDPSVDPTYEDIQAIKQMERWVQHKQKEDMERKNRPSKLGKGGRGGASTTRERIK